MKIPAPPLYNVPVHASNDHTDGQGDDDGALRASNDMKDNNLAYHGYYSSHNSSNGDVSGNGQGHHGQAHHKHYRTAQTVYHDPTNTHDQQQNPQRLGLGEAERYDQSSYYNQSLEQQTSCHEESSDEAVAPSTPSSSIKEKLLPNVFSLAQKLLPTVMKRLNQQEKKRLHHHEQQYDDDFSGTCSPLGSIANSPTPAKLFVPYNDNLKSTGLQESDYTSSTYQDNEEGDGTVLSADDVEIGEMDQEDPMKYLPRSAALLVNALQSSVKKPKKRTANGNGAVADVVNTMSKTNYSLENLPSLMDDVVMTLFKSNSDMSAQEFYNTPTKRRVRSSEKMLDMVSKEREADQLLESIRKDDLDGSGRMRRIGGSLSRRGSQNSEEADAIAASDSAVAIGGASTFDDDDGSIGGDMARLSHSIAHLQRDLENVDFSCLDDIYDDGSVGTALDGRDGENGMLARFKLWFSRGMIMEQKLLHTYVNPNNNNDGGSDGNTDTTTDAAASSGRYVDNPVLVWSLALMWAFVVLILMHPKIAELFEGQGDPGQLADIIEWLFG